MMFGTQYWVATFHHWKQKFEGLGATEVRRITQLQQEENRKLKQLATDLSLDRSMLQDALKGKI